MRSNTRQSGPDSKWSLIESGLEIHYDGDLPARSGLGSSSSFTVGLMHTLQGKMSSKEKLATDAIHIEQRPLRDMRKFPIY